MPAKKYVSKINKDGNDIYIKDTEALSINSCATIEECVAAANELT